LHPELLEELDVGAEFGFGATFTFGAEDESEPFGGDAVADAAESFAFFAVFDFAADADLAVFGHEDDVASGERDAGGDAGALGASGALGDLNHELLTGLDEFLDFAAAEFAPAEGGGGVVARVVGHDVGDIEEGVAFETDVYEGGVHAGEDVLDDALKDAPDDAFFTFDAVFEELSIFEDRDSGFATGAVDDNFDSPGEGRHAESGFGRPDRSFLQIRPQKWVTGIATKARFWETGTVAKSRVSIVAHT
jgi:hypothetical protein